MNTGLKRFLPVRINIFIVFLLFLFCFSSWSLRAEVIEETGSLRGFLAGSCPDAEYDNWLSHTVEGIADPGYNDYGPTGLDRQLDGFGTYRIIPDNPVGDGILNHWRRIFQLLISGNLDQVDLLLADSSDTWFYDIVLFHDTEFQQDYYVIREQLDEDFVDNAGTPNDPDDDVTGSFRNGWGIYIISPESPRPYLMMQMVHPNDDFVGVQIVVELFFRANCGAMSINGSGREVVWTEEGDYSNSKALSDPSRNGRAPLQVFQEVFAAAMDTTYPPGTMIVQGHSYDRSHTSPKSIVLSAGQNELFIHKPFRDRLYEHHDIIDLTPEIPVSANSFGWHPEVAIDDYYWLNYASAFPYYYHTEDGDSIRIPRASYLRCDPSNAQEVGLHANNDQFIDGATYENFIHFEVSEFPEILDDAGVDWMSLYGDERPPTYETFEPFVTYYDPFIDAFNEWFDILESGQDTTAPPRVTGLDLQPEEHEFRINWNDVADANFVSYEVLADTGELTENSPVIWDFHNDPELKAMTFDDNTTVTTLPDGYRWNVAVRGVDFDNNRGQLSDVGQVTIEDVDGVRLTPRQFDEFPLEAMPAWTISTVNDPDDLDSAFVEWFTLEGDSGYTLLKPILDNNIWGATFDIEEDEVAAGDTIFYRLNTIDFSETGNPRSFPDIDTWYNFVLTDEPGYPIDFDFEENDGSLSNNGDWEWGAPDSGPDSAYSGDRLWGTNLRGDYSNNQVSWLKIEDLDLGGYGPMVLTWTQWYEFEENTNEAGMAFDGGLVRVYRNNASYDVVPTGGYTHRIDSGSNDEDESDVFSGNSGGWATKAVGLTQWAGRDIDWVGLGAASNSTTTQDGWYIDDLAVVPVVNTMPPQWFTLVGPEDDTDVDPYEGIQFEWNPAIDPDPNAIPVYELILALNEDTISVYAGDNESINVQLDTVGLSTNFPAYIYWWVEANSQGDRVTSINTWRVAVPPFNEVPEETRLPENFSLEAAYPNPFNPSLHLKIAVPVKSMINLKVFNVLGRQVDVITKRIIQPGNHEITWNADNFASGVYLVRMEAGSFTTARKVVLVK